MVRIYTVRTAHNALDFLNRTEALRAVFSNRELRRPTRMTMVATTVTVDEAEDRCIDFYC